MQPIDAIVAAFLTFLLIGGVLLVSAVRRGRVLCDELALRFPSKYEALGRPQPGFFDGPRRTAYMRFVMRSEFADLEDPNLVAQFAALRRSEMRQFVFLLAGFGVLGVAALWFEFVRPG